MARREYGAGSVYQRHEKRYGCPPVNDGQRPAHKCGARWYGVAEAGWTASGTRDRVSVSGKTKGEATRKLRERRAQVDVGDSSLSARTTVKQWSETYLKMRLDDLRPNAWNAASSPINKWVVPTIGHRRLSDLTPADVRKIATAQHDAGRKTATAAATQRALMTMLRYAVREGHVVPQRVLMSPKPKAAPSDRTTLSEADTVACLWVAATLAHGIRWVLALVFGARQGEVLGLTDDAIDWEARTITLSWQLQALPYRDPKDKAAGFRVPRNYESIQLDKAWHLVRPKSGAGMRVLVMDDTIEAAMRQWLKIRPANPWGLLFPTAAGSPQRAKVDREEWWAIQCTAEVGHPTSPRWYHVHECRNFAATAMDEAGVSENVIQSTLGHASINQSRQYMRAGMDAKRAATEAVVARIAAGSAAALELK